MRIFEIATKTALVRSRIPGVQFVINPYLGCGHGCRYCYAVFMKKYSHHNPHTRWGDFVEAKMNIVEVLRRELARRRDPATAYLSSTCDPYQPAEATCRLTRGCLEALRDYQWSADVLTRSPLVIRDLDLLCALRKASVGFSIGTDDERVRQMLEPRAPPIRARLEALRQVHEAGISTWVFVAPMLPMNPERLAESIAPYADEVWFDALNYAGRVASLFRKLGWAYALEPAYAARTREHLARLLGEKARG